LTNFFHRAAVGERSNEVYNKKVATLKVKNNKQHMKNIVLSAAILGMAIFFASATSINAQTAGFPDDVAGITAYVKLETISQDNFDQARQNLFDYVESYDSTHMIGVKTYSATNEYVDGEAENGINIHIYLAADGWLAAYLKNDETISHIVNWEANASLDQTWLKVALQDAMEKINILPAEEIRYYDFSNPEALKMTLARESITSDETDTSGNSVLSKDFSVLIQGNLNKLSWAMKSINGSCPMGTGIRPVGFVLDSYSMVSGGCNNFIYGDYTGTAFDDQQSHNIKVRKIQDQLYVDAAGVFVFIYGN
jgi:hypothetical protein